jgi:hypothetical protein
MGTISVNLVGQAPSGTVYRLRDATIVVQGPTGMTSFDTEDDPDRASLSADVVVGNYSSTLQPGWRIERVEGASTTAVPAELKSNNPVQFTVAEHQRTTVPAASHARPAAAWAAQPAERGPAPLPPPRPHRHRPRSRRALPRASTTT